MVEVTPGQGVETAIPVTMTDALVAARAYFDADRAEDAERLSRLVLDVHPGQPDAGHLLGISRFQQGDHAEAERVLRLLTTEYRDYPNGLFNFGCALLLQGRLTEAREAFTQALEVDPASSSAEQNLATVYYSLGETVAATAHYRRALELRPDYMNAFLNLQMLLDFDYERPPGVIAAERRELAEQYLRPIYGWPQPYRNDRTADRRLRVGYVSPDFRQHSASYAFAPVIAHHDPEQVEVYCYYNHPAEDGQTKRLKAAAHHWRDVAGWPDERVIHAVYEDGIDVLVDLGGYAADGRLGTFASRPAPVQVHAWGAVTGTGMWQMDYLLADATTAPECHEERYTEQIVRLPAILPYEPPEDTPLIPELPYDRNGYVTFGCLNRLAKLSPLAIDRWGGLLRAMPDSRLILKDASLNEEENRARLRRLFAERGVASERLAFLARTVHCEHVAVYADIDVALDPAPQNGGITTLEALWHGVPVLAVLGDRLGGRLTASVLRVLNLGDYLALNDEHFVALGKLAIGNVERLRYVRAGLRERMQASILCDYPRYTRAVEEAYRAMWRRWCVEHVRL